MLASVSIQIRGQVFFMETWADNKIALSTELKLFQLYDLLGY